MKAGTLRSASATRYASSVSGEAASIALAAATSKRAWSLRIERRTDRGRNRCERSLDAGRVLAPALRGGSRAAPFAAEQRHHRAKYVTRRDAAGLSVVAHGHERRHLALFTTDDGEHALREPAAQGIRERADGCARISPDGQAFHALDGLHPGRIFVDARSCELCLHGFNAFFQFPALVREARDG